MTQFPNFLLDLNFFQTVQLIYILPLGHQDNLLEEFNLATFIN